MQSDMHYYGTYCLARVAGLKRNVAQIVASAAEFVDDAVHDTNVHMEDGRHLLPEMTAHKSIDLKNADADDQRRVWLPFHFLPGGQGTEIDEKLICRLDSPIAREMVNRNLIKAIEVDYGPHLVGITAHVYADTFAHYGFIGANHPLNGVKDGTLRIIGKTDSITEYVEKKARGFFANILSAVISDAFPLGHGAVATYPDRPYLQWTYVNEVTGEVVVRDNREDYLKGAKALYSMFQRYRSLKPQLRDETVERNWPEVRGQIKNILALRLDKEERAAAWRKAMATPDALIAGSERIPAYLGDKWIKDIEAWHFRPAQAPAAGDIVKTNIHRYYRAARAHRNMIITDLLPEKGILAA